MPIAIQCPNTLCRFQSMVPDAFAGRGVKCKKCGTSFQGNRDARRLVIGNEAAFAVAGCAISNTTRRVRVNARLKDVAKVRVVLTVIYLTSQTKRDTPLRDVGRPLRDGGTSSLGFIGRVG